MKRTSYSYRCVCGWKGSRVPEQRTPCACGAPFETLVRAIPRGPINRVTPPITALPRPPAPEANVVRLIWVRPTYAPARIAKVVRPPSAWEWEEYFQFTE